MLTDYLIHAAKPAQLVLPEKLLTIQLSVSELEKMERDLAARAAVIAPTSLPAQQGYFVALRRAQEETIYVKIGNGFPFATLEKELLGRRVGESVEHDGSPWEIVSIKRKTVPALTDAQAGQLGLDGVTDLTSLRQYCVQTASDAEKNRRFNGLRNFVVKELMKASAFSVTPESPEVETFFESMVSSVRLRAQGQGISFVEAAHALRLANGQEAKTEAECRTPMRERAMEVVKKAALGCCYAQEDQVVFSVDSVREEYQSAAEDMGTTLEQLLAGTTLEALVINQYENYLYEYIYNYYDSRYTVLIQA